MFSTRKDFIYFEDRLVEVLRVFTESYIKDREGLKEFLEADTILRRDGKLYYCLTVTEPEIVE
jgi:hypothetical protein